jgi:hypothetical protein
MRSSNWGVLEGLTPLIFSKTAGMIFLNFAYRLVIMSCACIINFIIGPTQVWRKLQKSVCSCTAGVTAYIRFYFYLAVTPEDDVTIIK